MKLIKRLKKRIKKFSREKCKHEKRESPITTTGTIDFVWYGNDCDTTSTKKEVE